LQRRPDFYPGKRRIRCRAQGGRFWLLAFRQSALSDINAKLEAIGRVPAGKGEK
jgi:hypothetical protein